MDRRARADDRPLATSPMLNARAARTLRFPPIVIILIHRSSTFQRGAPEWEITRAIDAHERFALVSLCWQMTGGDPPNGFAHHGRRDISSRTQARPMRKQGDGRIS